MYKIIIDTNLWISYLLGKKLIKLKDLFLNKKVSVITCQELIEEFVDVSSRNYITKYVEKKNILEALDLMREFSVQVQLENITVPELNDPDDLFLFALSYAVKADFILTGDKGLWALKKYKGTEIISYSDFISRLEFAKG
ncbi:MAG: putative toxin-antitoxin system toxin component, PIN family [Fibromonadaceae bacterium]|jgi:putative PIN family toxin of toxin-antitoxin system|nr:putative toxin-antitoxin system toxin component, PIN family [Fibromonadaceae bacterium]